MDYITSTLFSMDYVTLVLIVHGLLALTYFKPEVWHPFDAWRKVTKFDIVLGTILSLLFFLAVGW